MRILIIEPYFTGSHQLWAEGYKNHSEHDIEILSLEGRYWKWRMHGGAVTLAARFVEEKYRPDLILATDMLDLTTFIALARGVIYDIPIALYFHENQLTYPWSLDDRDILAGRDNHYGFINYASALTAERVFFNSEYHRNSFLGALPNFLKGFPDYNELETIGRITEKSQILNLGLDLARFDEYDEIEKEENAPVLLWNHRWEYDKNPRDFFEALYSLQEEEVDFKLIVLGENFSRQPEEFDIARERLGERILHFGYVERFEDYAKWLRKADIIPVTSNQDFFGGSIVEAMYCGVIPLLPNRLAYPQHIPDKLRDILIYESAAEFVPKLKALLNTYNAIDRSALKAQVAEYDWCKMSTVYDEALSTVRLPK